MTANNITYAVFGKPSGLFGNDQGYWDFFAERDEPGRLPVWGFATVTESKAEDVAPGDRFYGYYPMAETAVLTVGKPGPGGFLDVHSRAATLPPLLNLLSRAQDLEGY